MRSEWRAYADEEWDRVTLAYYNLDQDVQHYVTFVVVGFGGRLVQSLGPKGPMTEFDNFEVLMIKEWPSTAFDEPGLVAGAHSYPASTGVRCLI